MNKYLIFTILIMVQNTIYASEKLSNLIIPVTYFVDHIKQLQQIRDDLIKYRQASLVGVSGLGKTQVARMYAYENRKRYKLIWFVDCNLDIDEELLKLARLINSDENEQVITEDIKHIRQALKEYLVNKDEWLLVFDNLKIGENKKVQEFIKWEYNGNIIFCSQDSELLSNFIKITIFDKPDAAHLAQKILGNNSPELAAFLVQEFNGYPILIVQGALLLKQIPGLSMEEYKKKIGDSADKVKLNITLAMNELKPSARELINKISLINNQAFSKELLKMIVDSKETLDSDIYDLLKFSLIANIDPSQDNPVFEMHDVVASKVQEINGMQKNRQNLTQIITVLNKMLPKNVFQNYSLRNTKTFFENLEVVVLNEHRLNIRLHNLISFNLMLLTNYLNLKDYYKAQKQVEWFKKNEHKFNLWLMDNEEKGILGGYLGDIGVYYEYGEGNYNQALFYCRRSIDILKETKGYNSWLFNMIFHAAMSNIALGKLGEAKNYIVDLEGMINNKVVSPGEESFVYLAKSKLRYYEGNYNDALLFIDESIKLDISYGLDPEEQIFTTAYILKSVILNSLGKHEESYEQAQRLYKMHRNDKQEDHEIFGRIYTQMARSKLGLDKVKEAVEHVNKAISIFLADEARNPKDQDYSEDSELALAYLVQGDALFAQDNMREALKSYHKAYTIYYYLYHDHRKNVAQVSYLYNQAAKSSCKSQDLNNYKFFSELQIEEFGISHPNSQDMIRYCKQYNINLFQQLD